MALVPIAIGIGVSLATAGISYLLQPSPKTQKVGATEPTLPKFDYGADIPIIYGKVRLAPFFLFPNDANIMYRQETTTTSSGGGKGGGRSQKTETTETYATFALLYCEGETNLDYIILKENRYNTANEVFQKYFTWFDGAQTTPWDVFENKDEGIYRELVYKNHSYLGIEDLPNEYFDYQIDAVVEASDFLESCTLDVVVKDLCERQIKLLIEQGLAVEDDLLRIDVTELNPIQLKSGLVVNRSSGGYVQALQTLQTLYLFTAVETNDGKIKFKLFNRPSTETALVIPPEHFFPDNDGNLIYTRQRSPKEKEGLPSQMIIKYTQRGKYVPDQLVAYFEEGDRSNIFTLETNMCAERGDLQVLLLGINKFLAKWQKHIYSFSIPATYRSQIEGLSLIELPNGEIVQVYQINSGNDYTLRIDASSYTGELDLVQPDNDPIETIPEYQLPTIPNVYILDIRQIEDYPPSTLYVLATSANNLLISVDGGVTTKESVNHLTASTIGTCLTPLPNNSGGLDVVNSLDIELESGMVEGISQAQFDNPELFNLALIAVQYPNGYYNGKFVQFRDVTALGNNQYRLSYIFQGWYNSESFDTSQLPLKFFLLKGNGAYYSTIPGTAEFIGQPITATPIVSSAQNLATTPTTTFTPSGNSYTPPPVFNLQAEEDSEGNIRLTWNYLSLVSAYSNQTDVNNITYEVVIGNDVRVLTTDKKQIIYLTGDRADDSVTKPFDVTVYAVNSVFGRGIPTSITVNTTPISGTVFGTGEDGFKGIKTITNDAIAPTQFSYTVTEDDNNWILLVINPNVTYSDLEFPNTLSNGFTCQVIADGTTSDINSRVRFIVSDLLQPDDNLDILAGSTVTVTHAGSGKYSILGNNRKYLQVNSDNSIAVRKTWNFLSKNLNTPTQSINIEYLEDFGDRSNIIYSANDSYFETLIRNFLVAGTNISIVYDNILNELVISNTLTNESIQDMISSFLIAGTNISLSYNDTANTLTINNIATPALDAEAIQDMLSTFLVAGSNTELLYNDTANTLTINSTATGGGGGSGGTAIAKYYIQGNISNNTRITPVLNKSIHSIKLFNNAGTSQDIRVACKVGANTLTQDAYLLPSQQTISFNYKYPINFVSANDGIALECSSGNVNYFIEYSDANTDSFVQTSVAGNTLTTVYTATGNIAIPFIKLLNANTTVASQVVSLYVQGVLRETVTLLQGQSINLSPDTSINLSSGQTVALQCTVGIVNCFIQTTNV